MSRIYIVVFCLFFLAKGHAQQSFSIGGEATGIGGEMSFSTGQIGYVVNSDAQFSMQDGVQQAREFMIVSQVDALVLALNLEVYPNPCTHQLFLNQKIDTQEQVRYELTNSMGIVVRQGFLNTGNNAIDIEALPAAIYFVRVSSNNEPLQSFKIIKK